MLQRSAAMGAGRLELELRCPKRVNGIEVDPIPDWTFDDLISELNYLEMKLTVSNKFHNDPFDKVIISRQLANGNKEKRNRKSFLMRVPDYNEMDSDSSEDEQDKNLVPVKRFGCDELYLSDIDISDDEVIPEGQASIMEEVSVVESAFMELTREHKVEDQEEIRNQVSVLEKELLISSGKLASALSRVEKYKETRRELDRKFDNQFQRKIAEALDNHLTAVQRDHEMRSQIEERKIRSDAAYEEARRKEKSLLEEKLRLERAKAEAEALAKRKAEEAQRAAVEAERRTAIEAEKKSASKRNDNEKLSTVSSGEIQGSAQHQPGSLSILNAKQTNLNKSSEGNLCRATPSAMNIERERMQKLKEISETNKALRLSSNKDYTSIERHISRLIRQIRAIKDNVRSKAGELIKIINGPYCPQSLWIEMFTKKVIAQCVNPDNATCACGHVIVLVTSQVPHAMDILLAEFHKVCIYTVPKHIVYLESAFESKDAYYKSLGYLQTDDGQIESSEDYLKRMEAYVKLYGAIVQTEVPGVQNLHGLAEGWTWLARFLNALPANKSTGVVLNAFLQVAGYGLYRKYKSQFNKLLNIISDNFLFALRARQDSSLASTVVELQSYIEDKKFLQEPEGRSLQSQLLSDFFMT